jgi:hypothetical protein
MHFTSCDHWATILLLSFKVRPSSCLLRYRSSNVCSTVRWRRFIRSKIPSNRMNQSSNLGQFLIPSSSNLGQFLHPYPWCEKYLNFSNNKQKTHTQKCEHRSRRGILILYFLCSLFMTRLRWLILMFHDFPNSKWSQFISYWLKII